MVSGSHVTVHCIWLSGSSCNAPYIWLPITPQGFDEFMNLVVDEAEEIHFKTETRKKLGKCCAGSKEISN